MKISVLVPYRRDEGRRDELWRWVYPRILIVLGHHHEPHFVFADDAGDDPVLFNRPQALNRAARRTDGNVILIADADTTFDDPAPLIKAIEMTSRDGVWRMPQTYTQLTRDGTDLFMAGSTLEEIGPDGVLWEGSAVSWSGLVVIPREAWDLVAGGDERYVGWGADDVALGLALDTLYGPHERYPGGAVHLWHGRDEQNTGGHRNSRAQNALTEEYERAAGDLERMGRLVQEKREYGAAGRGRK